MLLPNAMFWKRATTHRGAGKFAAARDFFHRGVAGLLIAGAMFTAMAARAQSGVTGGAARRTVAARDIEPVGRIIGVDAQANRIHQIHANGIAIGYKLIGSGAPLVMIMGAGETIDHWPPELIASLARNYQLILLDNRGIGFTTDQLMLVDNRSDRKTTAGRQAFTCKLFADDVMALLDALGVRQANVLGYGMGSAVAEELLVKYPQRLKKAIIYASATDGSQAVQTGPGETSDDPTVARQMKAATRWQAPLDKLSLITNQVMFVVGTADAAAGVASSKTLAAAVPGAWLVQFKNGAHALMKQTPAEFARIVLTFLEVDETVEAKQSAPQNPPAMK